MKTRDEIGNPSWEVLYFDMCDLGSFATVISVTWEILVLRVSKQLSGASRDLGSIGPDLGSFGATICVTWEVLVLRVGK
jgi:hypothetical protein